MVLNDVTDQHRAYVATLLKKMKEADPDMDLDAFTGVKNLDQKLATMENVVANPVLEEDYEGDIEIVNTEVEDVDLEEYIQEDVDENMEEDAPYIDSEEFEEFEEEEEEEGEKDLYADFEYKVEWWKDRNFVGKYNIDIDRLDTLTKVLDTLYGKNYDITLTRLSDAFSYDSFSVNDFSIVIHYPEFIITNGRNKHTIKHLFVMLIIDLTTFNLTRSSLFGLRAYRTFEEEAYSYSHSHLTSVNRPRYADNYGFSSFCLGSGFMPNMLSKYKSIEPLTNSMMIQSFFLAINSYVSWESGSGGPYRRISKIGVKGTKLNKKNGNNYGSYDVSTFIDIISSYISDKLLFKYSSNKYHILNFNDIINEDTIIGTDDLYSEVVSALSYYARINVLADKVGDIYYKRNTLNTSIVTDDTTYILPDIFNYRGKKVKYVAKNDSNTDYTIVKTFNPYFIKAVIHSIENTINEKFYEQFNEEEFINESELKYTNRGIKPDQETVFKYL